MSTIVVECPGCQSRFKLKNAEKLAGKKVRCKNCDSPISVQLPNKVSRKAAAPKPAEQDVDFDIGQEASAEEEFADDEYGEPLAALPALPGRPRQLPSKPKAKTKRAGTGD